MNRLAVALFSLAFLAAPLAAEAQPAGKVYRIGALQTGPCARYAINKSRGGGTLP